MDTDNWEIWKDEYDEICRLEMKEGRTDTDISRRFLIFTEGFVYKVLTTDMSKLSDKNKKILRELRENNLMMKLKRGGIEEK